MFTSFIYQLVDKKQTQFKLAKFQLLAEDRFSAVESQIDYSLSSLTALKAFFESNSSVSREQFTTFSHSILQQYPEIQALEWIPIVPDEQRELFESVARKEGLNEFVFQERDELGEVLTAKKRAEYYPVYYVEPLQNNRAALGFDLGSNETRRKTIQHSIRTNALTITAPITLVQETGSQQAILALQPLFLEKTLADTDRISTVIPGFVLLVLRMDDFFENAISTTFHGNTIQMSIIDAEKKTHLVNGSRAQTSALFHEKLISVGGREWLVSVSADKYFMAHTDLQLWLVLVLGGLLSLVFASYIYIVNHQKGLIKDEVRIRTQQLNDSQESYKAIIDTASDGVISINESGIITRYNDRAEDILGFSADETIGQNVSMLTGDEHAHQHDDYIRNYLNTGVKKIIGIGREVHAQHKDGHLLPIRLAISDTGIEGALRFTGIISDLSEIDATKKSLEKAIVALKFISETDPLTKIPNRRVYEQSLTKEVASAKRSHSPLTLIMIDIDFFKEYNDHYGHHEGDMALHAIAQELKKSLPRVTDCVARYGGEEFVVLMPATDSKGAYIVAETIRANIKELGIPHFYGTSSHVVTISIGIASLEGNDLNEDALLENADNALYMAKQKGRNQCYIYGS